MTASDRERLYGMRDDLGRNIDYLRISVTDKCNLRCKYCMPPAGVEQIPHGELLTLEELARLVGIMAELGIRKVRFTGGEPLVRKNLVKLMADVHEMEGIEEIALTTNGVLLAENLPALTRAGLTAVNISLDSVRPETFHKITGTDACGKVLDAIERAAASGIRTRVNCVPCREWNAGELAEVAALAGRLPVDVRFIELMPVGCGRQFHGVPTEEVLRLLEEAYGEMRPVSSVSGTGGPAKYYMPEGFIGRIGFISPMSHKFCGDCNRIRLTAEGRLKLCLHYNAGVDLRALLRGGGTDEEIRATITAAVRAKPAAHDFEHTAERDISDSDSRRMVQIGG
ncbi:MAG: GTP 3',8-cyclase MoaA [Clostridium sp.]|nr:GTP 3',8-cyclase MoaA [Acetatifactor muris]MCM1527340.1 GTP 3',8-cyclase MoaA [Bacteroides sp.]MCM1563619.1 GTP 3',8-cyclase MoaA [Clostridium sp.]